MFKVEEIEGEIIKKVETVGTYDYVKVSLNDGSKNHCVLTKKCVDQYLKRIKEMEIYEDDLWIVTYPKCGTTWTQEMMWLLNNNLDYDRAMKENLVERYPFIEIGAIIIDLKIDSFEVCDKLSRPRHIKSHLPLFLMPDKIWTIKPKIVYVARNPKDTAISYYHHYRHLQGYRGTKEDFLSAFISNQILYSPFNDHVIEFWKIRDKQNILFLFYEDMKRNLENEVKKGMKFLGKNYSQEQIEKLCQHLSIDSMRNNPSCNNDGLVQMLKIVNKNDDDENDKDFRFIRKGQIGSHKDELTNEEDQKFSAFFNDQQLLKNNFSYKF